MEKNKIRNLNIKTKLKALLLSGVTLLTGISCGKSDVKAPEKDNSIAIEAETNTKTTKNTIESTVDNMIAEKETQENNTNDYVENYNYENEENNYVEDETNIETTETKTEEKTENKIEAPSKVYEEEIVMPKKGASMTPSTNHTTTKIKNSDIKITTTKAHTQHPTTTKKVTTTQRHTTAKPVTTTVRVTEPPVTQPPTIPYENRTYTKYDLMSDDPNVALFAHKNLAFQLGNELFNGYLHETSYGTTSGHAEAGALIVALNYNQPLNIDALGNRYNYESKEDFIKLTDNMDLASYQCMYNSRVDFTKYVIDEDFANYLNMVSEQCINFVNGDEEPLLNEINNYFDNVYNGIDNYAKYYFMYNVKSRADYCTPEEMEEARRMFVDNVSSYIYDKFEPHKSKTLAR